MYRQVRRWPLTEIDGKQTGRSSVARGLTFCLCNDTEGRRLCVGWSKSEDTVRWDAQRLEIIGIGSAADGLVNKLAFRFLPLTIRSFSSCLNCTIATAHPANGERHGQNGLVERRISSFCT